MHSLLKLRERECIWLFQQNAHNTISFLSALCNDLYYKFTVDFKYLSIFPLTRIVIGILAFSLSDAISLGLLLYHSFFRSSNCTGNFLFLHQSYLTLRTIRRSDNGYIREMHLLVKENTTVSLRSCEYMCTTTCL